MRIANEVLMYFRGTKKSSGEISLSESIETDGEGGELCLMDVVYLEEDMLERISQKELSSRIQELVSGKLDEREGTIIRLRYGLDGNTPKTQREVADACEISRSYVSRLEKKALEKLRREFEKINR